MTHSKKRSQLSTHNIYTYIIAQQLGIHSRTEQEQLMYIKRYVKVICKLSGLFLQVCTYIKFVKI